MNNKKYKRFIELKIKHKEKSNKNQQQPIKIFTTFTKQKVKQNDIKYFTNKVNNILFKKEHLFIDTIANMDKMVNYNYSRVNRKTLKYYINNLSGMNNKFTNEKVFNIEYIAKYVDIYKDKYYITDKDNNYLKKIDKQTNSKIFSKVKYIDYISMILEKRIPVFLTLTSPSKYHYYKQKSEKDKTLIRNKLCEYDTLGATIEASFEQHKNMNRSLFNKMKDKFIKKGINKDFRYIRVFEFHRNKTIHTHSLIYLTQEQLKYFYGLYHNLVNKFELEQTKLELISKEQAKKNGKSYATPTSYLTKYLLKNQGFNEYKRYFSNYRMVSSSAYLHTNQKVIEKVYSYLKKSRKDIFKKLIESDIPIYYSIEKYILENIDYKIEKVEHHSSDYNLEKEINLKIAKELIYLKSMKKYRTKDISKKEQLENDYHFVKEKILDEIDDSWILKSKNLNKITYKQDLLYIFDKKYNCLVFDKGNFEKGKSMFEVEEYNSAILKKIDLISHIKNLF